MQSTTEMEKATTPPEDGYGLKRTYASSIRLNLQHFLWKDTLGYNIHPAIPLPAPGKVWNIADVGTGTAIWPIDIAHEYPWARIDALDVSLDQAPPPAWLPENVSLVKLDIFSPVPEDLVGKYDIINIRLFLVVVRDNDPTPILQSVMRLLKPGGYLQWSEHNFDTTTIVSTGPPVQDSGIHRLNQILLDTGYGKWVPHLSEIFREHGFSDVLREKYSVKPHFRSFFTQMTCMSTEEFSWAVLDNSGPEAGGPQLRRLIQAAADDSRNGRALGYVLEAAIGRKA